MKRRRAPFRRVPGGLAAKSCVIRYDYLNPNVLGFSIVRFRCQSRDFRERFRYLFEPPGMQFCRCRHGRRTLSMREGG